jgi:hypothetical protein
MPDVENAPTPPEVARRRPAGRIIGGFALALTLAFSAYLLLSFSRSGSLWFASVWFLALLPAVLCALICYIGDPDRSRSATFYWLVPPVLCGLVCAGSVVFLHEGVICLVMLSPIWLASGWAGAFTMRSQRRRSGHRVQSSFLILPLVAGLVEAAIPIPHETVSLSRSVVIQAAPEVIWPYAVSSRDISETEGRWTITHNLIGMPRPRETVIDKAGVGAVRTAYWGDHVNFEERIVEWQPGRKIGWRFNFTNSSVQDYTDRHIAPDGEFLKVDSGDYTLRRISGGATELTLTTRYIAKTHINPYARLWGELMMGDVEENVLTIIKDRAERTSVAETVRAVGSTT